MVRWPSDSMFASLCERFQTAPVRSKQTPHRMPQMRFGHHRFAVAGAAEDDAPLELAARHRLGDRRTKSG